MGQSYLIITDSDGVEQGPSLNPVLIWWNTDNVTSGNDK
jgi:hypothetical protein